MSTPTSPRPTTPRPLPLLETYAATLTRRQSHSGRRRLTLTPAGSVDFSSNDFLSLSLSPALRTAYISEFTDASATLPLGSTGSRLLDGNSTYIESLESSIAHFHNAPAGLIFNSGYDANSGLFSCISQKDDIILYDEYIHASVHEGMRLGRAERCLAFRHNDVAAFETTLRSLRDGDANVRSGTSNVFVAVESVYSMDGDVAPIARMLDIMDALLPERNGHLIVDEAHATGVYGDKGRGVVCALGVEDRVFARLHTFGKALSCGGAIILCSPTLRDYLTNYARSLIYTTAPGLPTLAMVRSVYALLRSGATEPAQHRLWRLIAHLHAQLRTLPDSPDLPLPAPDARPQSPIFSLPTPHPRALAAYCQARGFVVRAIVPPTVPEGGQRVRVCLHSGNTEGEVEALVECVRAWVVERARGDVDEGRVERSRL